MKSVGHGEPWEGFGRREIRPVAVAAAWGTAWGAESRVGRPVMWRWCCRGERSRQLWTKRSAGLEEGGFGKSAGAQVPTPPSSPLALEAEAGCEV